MTLPDTEADELERLAYAAFDAGSLDEAATRFGELLRLRPGNATLHYMSGLAYKYLRDWGASLKANLRAQELFGEFNEASCWNAGIAATGLGNYAEARRQWERCGIELPEGEGPIEGNFGISSIRINPWDGAETLFARRLDPVRARLLNVPLPESGFRFGDVVLNDGASTGRRRYGDGTVPVFNGLQRLEQSEFLTFGCIVTCPNRHDAEQLDSASGPGIGFIEDWTDMKWYCMRCSYGTPHEHEVTEPEDDAEPETRDESRLVIESAESENDDEVIDDDWQLERTFGIAAQHRKSVVKLLESWKRKGAGRLIESISYRDHPLKDPSGQGVWWRRDDDDVPAEPVTDAESP